MFNIKEKDAKMGIMLLVLGGIIYFLIRVHVILIPFVVGIILAYLFYPLINFMRKMNIPKIWAIYILIIIFLLSGIIISVVFIPAFLHELDNLTNAIPEYINKIDKYIDYLNHQYRRVNLPPIIKEVLDRTLNKTEEQVISLMENLTEIIINSLSTLISLVISPFIAFYILKDLNKLKRALIKCIPGEKRRVFFDMGVDINKIFLGYLRGQIWISIIVGVLSVIGLTIFRIRFSLLLGFFAGISNMVPFIGPIIGSVPAVLIAFLTSPERAVSIAILFFIIQQLESSLISPRILSNEIGLHPLIVIFFLLAGAELYGIWGLLLAVPVAGSLIVVVKFLFNLFQSSPE
ncbi:MAG: AI-2E family transporter [Halanaerobiales bacterium]